MKNWFKNLGPGTFIAAAFIGPGTVTMCTLAGSNFGFSLLWALTLSIVATYFLQEIAARVGILTQKGLASVIKDEIKNTVLKKLAIGLILAAIVIGNAAYEAGNISGASLGLTSVFGEESVQFAVFVIGLAAFIILYVGNYKILEKALISLVILMSISFVFTAIITKPSITQILKGAFVPVIPKNGMLTIIGLIGTTVVPYNLFLHASLVKEKWKNDQSLKVARKDALISIVLGGLVSMAIVIAAASINKESIQTINDLSKGLEPLYGNFAKYFLGFGLFAAGITSAITAPLAAAYVANSCFGWNAGLKDFKFRLVWLIILLIGVIFSSLKINPIEIIKFAQVANGILLPVIALFLFWIANNSKLLGKYKNTRLQNGILILILITTIVLGLKSILKVFEFI
jgi:Mn2+/Fe2+ NRAMP family transporter